MCHPRQLSLANTVDESGIEISTVMSPLRHTLLVNTLQPCAWPKYLIGGCLVFEKASPKLRFRVLLGLADLSLTSGAITDGKLRLKQAYGIAVNHNLVSATFDATFMLAIAEWMDGNMESALNISRQAIQALSDTDAVDNPWCFLMAAKIEAKCQNVESEGALYALSLLSQLRTTGAEQSMRKYMARAMEAECYTMRRCYPQAALGASEALRGFRKIGASCGLAYALRVTAESEEGIGNLKKARESIV